MCTLLPCFKLYYKLFARCSSLGAYLSSNSEAPFRVFSVFYSSYIDTSSLTLCTMYNAALSRITKINITGNGSCIPKTKRGLCRVRTGDLVSVSDM